MISPFTTAFSLKKCFLLL